MFYIITEINESKTLTKHISCDCKWGFDGRQCNSDQWWNNDKCWWECKKRHISKKDVWNLATCNCENEKFLANTMDDSVIICDEIIDADVKAKWHDEETKMFSTNFNEKKAICKT